MQLSYAHCKGAALWPQLHKALSTTPFSYDQHLYCHQNFKGSCLASSVNKHTTFMTCTYAPQTRDKSNSHYLEETWILVIIFPFPMTSLHYMWIQLENFPFWTSLEFPCAFKYQNRAHSKTYTDTCSYTNLRSGPPLLLLV